MADLTADELTQIRDRVGDGPTDLDLQERFDRDGSIDLVIRGVLEHRLANLLDRPDSFTVPGEYSESRSAQIKALQDAVAASGGEGYTVTVLSAADADAR